jgi:hypothetical protein
MATYQSAQASTTTAKSSAYSSRQSRKIARLGRKGIYFWIFTEGDGMNSANRYVVDCNRLWKGGKIMTEVDVGVVLASDYDSLRSSHSDLLEALQALLERLQLDGEAKAWFPKEQGDAIKAIAKALA